MLRDLSITATPLPPLTGADGCGATAPLAVTAVAGVRLLPAATLTCPVAATLQQWLTAVQPLARRELGSPIASLQVAASYSCRLRNGVAGARLSEHGKANAIDIAAFTLVDGHVVPVAGGGALVTAARQAACASFTTVLGPGSDAQHADHLHLDSLVRHGGYRICQ